MKYKHLVAVIGPSGSGKDSLLSGAAAVLADDPSYYFVAREITRPSGINGEGHVAVSDDEFHQRYDAGQYAISWQAHNVRYGINKSIEDRLAEGKMVVFNGSRAAIDEIREKFSGVSVIFVHAPADIIASRLASRGRESDAEVRERMSRNERLKTIPDGVIQITNAGSLQQTLDAFVGILQGISAQENIA